MILYVVYKKKKIAIEEQQLPQHKGDIVADDKLSTGTAIIAEVQIICSGKKEINGEEDDDDDEIIQQEKNKNHRRNEKSMEDNCFSNIIEVQPAATVKCEA